MPANLNVRYAGFAVETAAAGAAATNPQPGFYVDVAEAGIDSPTETDIEVPSSLGMTARAKRAGMYIPSGNIVYNSDIRTIGYFLRWGLMGYAFTAGPKDAGGNLTGYNTHEIWANDLRYVQEFCARIGKDQFEHVFERAVVNSLEISVERELVPVTVDMSASKDFEDVLKDVNSQIYPGLPEEYALAYHDIRLRLDKDGAGTMIDVSSIANSLTATIENNVDSEAGVTLGSRFSRRHGSSGRNISLSTELSFQDMAMKRKFWGDVNAAGLGSPGKLGGKNFPVEAYVDSGATFAAGNYGDALIQFPNCYFNSVPLSASGREEMTQGVEINVHTGKVTLVDGATVVRTPIYIRLRNRAGSML